MRVLMVGGKWDAVGGRPSGLFAKITEVVSASHEVAVRNGGDYRRLPRMLDDCHSYDCVFWMADVPNAFDKARAVRERSPHAMLVASRHGDGTRYETEATVKRALASGSDLVMEFSLGRGGYRFDMRVIDPLGNLWYEGDDPRAAADAIMGRIGFLATMERADVARGEGDATVPDQGEFVRYVRQVAGRVQATTPDLGASPHFRGNASFRGTPGMGVSPTPGDEETIFVSRRDVTNRFLEASDFVPTCLKDGLLLYRGDSEPSADASVQARLYQALPDVNYMIHMHCYAEGAPFTEKCLPCGTSQEVDEVLAVAGREPDGLASRSYVVNLRGHGCLLMAASLGEMPSAKLVTRPLPEPHGGMDV